VSGATLFVELDDFLPYLGACQRIQVEPSQFTKYELELPATRTTIRTPMVPAIGTVVCPSAATCSDCPAEVKTLRFASCNLRLKNYQKPQELPEPVCSMRSAGTGMEFSSLNVALIIQVPEGLPTGH